MSHQFPAGSTFKIIVLLLQTPSIVSTFTAHSKAEIMIFFQFFLNLKPNLASKSEFF